MSAALAPQTIEAVERIELRELARQVADFASQPEQAERRELWRKHNSLQPTRPLVLIFPEGAWEEILPDSALRCRTATAREIERDLRRRLYYRELLPDDSVCEREWRVGKVIRNTGWGLQAQRIASTAARGAWHFDPVLKTPADLKKLKMPDIEYDEAATRLRLDFATELFGDLLDVRLVGVGHISYHLMNQYTHWRGLEEAMVDMYDEPELLHEAMAFLEAGHHRILAQYQKQNLLSLNNDGTYQNSGGNGYTAELPAPGYSPDRVRPGDMWASAEAQELAQVGPAQHAEFVLPYESRLLEPFGLTGYGCCEPLHDRMELVFSLPRIRRISISPFSNVDICAPKMGNKYIFSWKPQPSYLVGEFNEPLIRNYIRHTLEVCREHGCHLELILKDTHTCESHPERFQRWAIIAKEEIGRATCVF